jgi:putative nucleotidyltransferase with HDIG domain
MSNRQIDAYALLHALGASKRLIHHARLVSQAADVLLVEVKSLGVPIDVRVVHFGAILHDIGKIRHQQELSEPGSLHEQAGEAMLLERGIDPAIARCCASHGAWNSPGVSLEERVVALADKLWKGKRETGLELLVVDEIATRLMVTRWDVFERLDTVFEEIAAGGSERVEQSRHF